MQKNSGFQRRQKTRANDGAKLSSFEHLGPAMEHPLYLKEKKWRSPPPHPSHWDLQLLRFGCPTRSPEK